MSSDHRQRLLAAVYGEQVAASIARRLEALIEPSSSDGAPGWSQESVWLIAYADSYIDPAEPAPLRTLRWMLDEHLSAIVDGVHILPFAPSSSDGGFAVIDYDAVDAQHGTWDDIEELTSQRPVMFDAVINHMSAESPWFRGFLDGDADREGFFRTGDRTADVSAVVRPRTHPLFTEFERHDGSAVDVWTTFSADQVDLDYANPEVLLRVIEVLIGYCRRGAAALRLDAIGFLWKDEATSSIHLPQTHHLIQLMRSVIDAVAPGTIIISETNVPHAENISYFGGPGEREVHAVYQFPLPPLVAHAALTGDTNVLEQWAATIDELVEPGRSFLNFLASHDGIGVRPAEGLLTDTQLDVLFRATRQVGGQINERSLPDGTTRPYELNTTWFDLMTADPATGGTVDESTAIERHLACHAVLLSLPGVGAIYTHSIVGEGNDRDGAERTGHARDLNRRRCTDPAGLAVDMAAPGTRAHRIRSGLERMVAARRANPAFHPEGSMRVLPSPDGLFAIDRRHGDARGRMIVNMGRHTANVASLVDGWVGTGTAVTPSDELPAGESLWLSRLTA